MCERGWGRIITISSGAGTAGVAIGVSPYSAGKGGGIGFTRTLALEVARSGVTANTLAIGLMGFPDPDVTAALAKSIPVGRTGQPGDIGAGLRLAGLGRGRLGHRADDPDQRRLDHDVSVDAYDRIAHDNPRWQ